MRRHRPRPLLRHAARFGAHPADGGGAAQPPQPPPRARGGADLHRRGCERAMRPSAPCRWTAGWIDALPGMRARWWNAGHMLGSASIEMEFARKPRPLRVLVSGDIGPDCSARSTAIRRDRTAIDHVFLESTYGDEDKPCIDHDARRESAREARAGRAPSRAGALLIPAFAVERTQEVMLGPRHADAVGAQVPMAPIMVDSPLAHRATRVFLEARRDAGGWRGRARAALPDCCNSPSTDGRQSRRSARSGRASTSSSPAAGMCEAGRIRGIT
jgi:metallo-beta-lactamase family protein